MSLSYQPSLQLFLRRLMARSVLDHAEQQAILALPHHIVQLRAKQDFVHVDEETSYCSLVASGLVARFGQTANGARQITAFHIPGDMADLHSTVRPIGIGGLTAMRQTAAHLPAIAEAVWRDSLLDAAILMQWVVNVGRRDARTGSPTSCARCGSATAAIAR